MKQQIEFTCHPLFDNALDYQPCPASNTLPEWYKELNSYINNKKTSGVGTTNATAKKCMPMFDMMTSGYLIPLMGDVYVTLDVEGKQYYEWGTSTLIEFHDPQQIKGHNKVGNFHALPKFINAWSVKTPKNYSSLFITPSNHDLPFEILSGIVDTDLFYSSVNFPFVMKDKNWTGLIKAGTPIAQVIPIKRDKWNHKINKDKLSKDLINKHHLIIKAVFNAGYKRLFWQRKEYK